MNADESVRPRLRFCVSRELAMDLGFFYFSRWENWVEREKKKPSPLNKGSIDNFPGADKTNFNIWWNSAS